MIYCAFEKYCVFRHDIFAWAAFYVIALHFANISRNASDGHMICTPNDLETILGRIARPDS